MYYMSISSQKKSNSMYIIAGSIKGRKIFLPQGSGIRPTLGRIRTTIFDILQFSMEKNPVILDCFAGSGILGIEAYSRWGGTMNFFEYNKTIADLLTKNLSNLGITIKANVFNINALKPKTATVAANIVFIDPPYNSSYIIPDCIKRLEKKMWLKKDTIIVCETAKDTNLKLPVFCTVIKEKIISSTKISFLTCNFETANLEQQVEDNAIEV